MGTYRLYHEKQEAGLCGVHCLNSLLQAPLFSEIDLATIARQLDAKERQLMAEAGTDTNDFLKYMAEDSGNVADDGNYSVQVLSEALKVFGVDVLPLGKQAPPPEVTAFICNLQEHWFSLRRLHGHWWDFNSLNSAPRWISDLALGVYLETLRQQGYSIFLIRGELPAPNAAATALSLGGRGRWLSVAAGGATQRSADSDLEAAIRASLGGGAKPAAKGKYSNHDVVDLTADDDEDALAAAIAASLAGSGGAPAATPPAQHQAVKRSAPEEDDPELAAALELSRQDSASASAPPAAKDAKPAAAAAKPASAPPSAPAPAPVVAAPAVVRREPPAEPPAGTAGAINVCVRMPDGSRWQRRFNGLDTLDDLHAATAQHSSATDFSLVSNGPPKRDLATLPQTTPLSQAGVANTLLIFEKR